MKQNGKKSLEEQQRLLCEKVGAHEIHESDEDLRARAWRVKNVIGEYKKEYRTVAIVSHWWVITFLLGEGYDSTSFPKGSPDIVNAKPYWTSLSKLMKYK